MADLRVVDAPVLLQESITDDVKMPTGGLGNYAIRLGDLVWYVVTKEQLVSKGYVDNLSKGVQDKLDSHIANKNNPHEVTKEQVGLGNVDNTADIDKPVSNAVNSAIITATNGMATASYLDSALAVQTQMVNNALSQLSTQASKFYPTLAEANADIANIEVNQPIQVGEAVNGGLWYKATQDATSLSKSPYDPYETSKGYTNLTIQSKISQFFDYDFDAIYSFVIVDLENNIIEAYDKGGNKVVLDGAKFTFDFYSDNSERIVLIDKDGNVIFKNQNSSDLNFKNLQLNQYQPTPLKNKEAYIKYDTLKIQNVLTDDIYNKSVVDIVTNTAAVYAFYDQLVIKHPNYMSSSVLGTDALGNEIRQYIYTPRPLQSIESEGGDTTWDAELIKPPKIVIMSGTHAGTEQEAILSAMILLKEVLERQNEIEAAMFLSQAQIVFIPVINPSGLNASTRHNHNDIDLNRDARQTADQIPSQLETRIGISLPTLHPDAICFFDLHNYDRNYVGAWLSTFTEATLAELKPVALKLNAEIKYDHPFFADVPIRLQKNAARTIARDWQQFGGAKRGILIETASEDTLYPIFQKRQLAQYVIKTAITHFLKLELGV